MSGAACCPAWNWTTAWPAPTSSGCVLVEITLHEGRKHIVRRMLAEAGHPVSRLVRTHVGPVALGTLRPGTTRPLTTREIGELYAAVGL